LSLSPDLDEEEQGGRSDGNQDRRDEDLGTLIVSELVSQKGEEEDV